MVKTIAKNMGKKEANFEIILARNKQKIINSMNNIENSSRRFNAKFKKIIKAL
ncbi:hypothetical protein KY314_03990 [Candidatus Woesearchaeota archaeon]|nr:hypothetical protein [Candidatus Woesearchaeota archaeon]